jgi:glutathione S-transferase
MVARARACCDQGALSTGIGMAGDEYILHHYDTSPFSEKPRLMFGLKGLAWRSVIQPNIMPKPDLTPLTGGYRRIPVMQIGADIFCDTQIVLAEIERRAPQPPAMRGGAFGVNLWADRLFFQATVPIIFGALGESIPKAFIEDREKLSGGAFNLPALKAAGELMRGPWRAHVGGIEAALKHDAFLGGARPSLEDIAAYMNIWFLANFLPPAYDALIAGFPRVRTWRERVAAIGHGQRSEMTAREALDVARDSEPAAPPAHDPSDPLGLAPGAAVTVSADDYGRDPVAGALVAANSERVVIAREQEGLGRLHVHFPRFGYIVRPA